MDSSWSDESLLTLVKEKSTNINSLVVINGKQCSQLMVACLHGNVKYVKELLQISEIDIAQQNNEGDHALMCACRQGHTEIVQLILDAIKNCTKNPELLVINFDDNDGWTSLMTASQNGHTEIVDLLLQNGAKVNMQNYKKWSSLMLASQNGHTETVALLLKKNAQQNYDGWSSLMLASRNGHTGTVDLLLQNNAQVNMQDYNRWSSLMFASQNGHTETVTLLLQHGARVNMENKDRQSSLMLARQNGHTETCTVLQDADEKIAKHDKTVQEKTEDKRIVIHRSSFQQKSDEQFYKHVGLSCAAKVIDLEDNIGISIVVPQDSLPPDEAVNLAIQPSFSGSFEMPEGIEPASPAYLIEITKKKVELKKSLLVKMQHYANLQTEEDCNSMVFLQANSENRGSKPVFKEVDGDKGKFTVSESQIGEINLTQFGWLRIGIRRIKRLSSGPPLLYSARLFYTYDQYICRLSIVFYICPYHIYYTKSCDNFIYVDYFEPLLRPSPTKAAVHNRVTISSDTITLRLMDEPPINISKAKIDLEGELISARIKNPPELLTLNVTGLDEECKFVIPVDPFTIRTLTEYEGLVSDMEGLSLAELEGHEPAEERATEPEKRVATEAERRISEGQQPPYSSGTIKTKYRIECEGLGSSVESRPHDKQPVPPYSSEASKTKYLTECEGLGSSVESHPHIVDVLPKNKPVQTVLPDSKEIKLMLLVKKEEFSAASDHITAPVRVNEHITGTFAGQKVALVQIRLVEEALQMFPKVCFILIVGVCHVSSHENGCVLIECIGELNLNLSHIFDDPLVTFEEIENREERSVLLQIVNSDDNKVKAGIIIKGVDDARSAFDYTKRMLTDKAELFDSIIAGFHWPASWISDSTDN